MSKGIKRKNPVLSSSSSDSSDEDDDYEVGKNSVETTEDAPYGVTNKSAQESSTGVIKLRVTELSNQKLKQSSYHIISHLPWCLKAKMECSKYVSNEKCLSTYIYCHPKSESMLWSCEAQVEFRLLAHKQPFKNGASSSSPPRADHKMKFTSTFKYGNTGMGYPSFIKWEELMKPESGYVRDDTALLEVHITVRKVAGVRPNPTYYFTLPGESTIGDGVVLIGRKRIHINKAYLAMYSPVMRALFFSDFRERSMEEIPLIGVSAKEFTELLAVIYPSQKAITKENVDYLLKLADQFQIQCVLNKCVDFLGTSEASSIPVAKKLLWADKYCLANLQDICLRMLRTPGQVKAIKLSTEYDQLSEKSKMALLEKLFKLLP